MGICRPPLEDYMMVYYKRPQRQNVNFLQYSTTANQKANHLQGMYQLQVAKKVLHNLTTNNCKTNVLIILTLKMNMSHEIL